MAEEIMHQGKGSGDKVSFWSILTGIVWSRFFLYLYDYIALRLPSTRRYRQLMHDYLICRFCGYAIDLLGAWKCECGFSRPGNYYGRCSKCVKHPRFIDCPSCTFTMDVR